MGLIETIGALANPIGTAVGAVGSIFNYSAELQNSQRAAEMSKYNTDATIKAQKDAANLAYQRNVEQWNRENEYNSPVQQMARLKAAGLNPMMAYGSGAIGANSAASSPQMSTINPQVHYQAAMRPKIDPMAIEQTAQSLAMGRAQIDQIRAQTALTLEEKKIRGVEAMYEAMRNLPREYSLNMGKLAGEAAVSLARGALDTGALSSDLAYRQGMVQTQKADLISKLNKNKLFPFEQSILESQSKGAPLDVEMKKTGLDLMRQSMPLDLQLKRLGLSEKELEIVGRRIANQLSGLDLAGKSIEYTQKTKGVHDAPWPIKAWYQNKSEWWNWSKKHIFDSRLWTPRKSRH